MRNFLPDPIYDSIAAHLRAIGNAAHDSWESGEADEDTLTGYLGSQLERPWSVPVEFNGETWKWRVKHKKFRGRGRGAFEKLSGADGIFQIEVDSPRAIPISQKGILYQAKKGDIRRGAAEKKQITRMEDMAPGASAIVTYDRGRYEGVGSVPYLQENRRDLIFSRDGPAQLGDFLADTFLSCKSGRNGLYYDANRKILVVPDLVGGAEHIPLEIGHRVVIQAYKEALY